MVVDRSALVRGAISVARRAHAGQGRETGCGEIPFIEHPIAVAELLKESGFDGPIISAAYLHDVVEKTDVKLDEIRERFGPDVAILVDFLSESCCQPAAGRRASAKRSGA